MNSEFQSLLILSTGRTGTKFLAKTLQQLVPEANVYHEGGERSRLINILSHASLSNIVPNQLPILVWRLLIQPDLEKTYNEKRYYIDANNHLYLFAIENQDLYPNLKIVHIVRDPRNYIRSHINWSTSRVKSFIANYLIPFWQPSGFLLGDLALSTWLRFSRVERFAWIWKFKNRFIRNLEYGQIPYLRVRFEDLFSAEQPGVVLEQILKFLGTHPTGDLAGYFRKSINASRDRLDSWPDWSPEVCKKIQNICGDDMSFYGYGSETAWIDKLSSGV